MASELELVKVFGEGIAVFGEVADRCINGMWPHPRQLYLVGSEILGFAFGM